MKEFFFFFGTGRIRSVGGAAGPRRVRVALRAAAQEAHVAAGGIGGGVEDARDGGEVAHGHDIGERLRRDGRVCERGQRRRPQLDARRRRRQVLEPADSGAHEAAGGGAAQVARRSPRD